MDCIPIWNAYSKPMETQNLSAFIHVAQLQSFSLAAEHLHLTQPAVSKRVAALEEQLGKKLFDRIGRTVTLTEAGNVLLPHALKIMQEVKETRRELADMSGEVAGVLQLATSHHIGLHRLPKVLHNYVQQYPQVDMQLRFIDSEKAYEEIIQGNIELAAITLPSAVPATISARTIWPDPLAFVVSPRHPLAKLKSVTLERLLQHPAILPDLSTHTTQIVRKLFDDHELDLSIGMTTNFLESIKMMITIELGWSVLPRTMVDKQLVPLRIPSVSLSRNLGVVYHRERSLSNAATAFLALFQ